MSTSLIDVLLPDESLLYHEMESTKDSSGGFATEIASTSAHETIESSDSAYGFCGEPLTAQRICLDFTPDEEVDTDYVQNKCCAFWNFIHNLPVIQNMVIEPETNVEFQTSDASLDDSFVSTEEKKTAETESKDLKDRTALSMLEFAENKGLIDRTFEAKIHESHCTMGSREYRELEKPPKKQSPDVCDQCKRPDWCAMFSRCLCVKHPEPSPLKKLVRDMMAWDAVHPKSMEVPSHAPSLQHSVLQRKPATSAHTGTVSLP